MRAATDAERPGAGVVPVEEWQGLRKQWLPAAYSDEVDGYLASVTQAVRNHTRFLSFRRDYAYRRIVETVTVAEGYEHLRHLWRLGPGRAELLQAAKLIDLVGSPRTHDYGPAVGALSPTTLRYTRVLSDIFSEFREAGCQVRRRAWRVLEIGAGFGGLRLAWHLATPPAEYVVLDLPEVMLLIHRVLAQFPGSLGRTKFAGPDLFEGAGLFDLCVSAFAYSEFQPEYQARIMRLVFPRCRRGLIVDNALSQGPFAMVGHRLRRALGRFAAVRSKSVVWGGFRSSRVFWRVRAANWTAAAELACEGRSAPPARG